MSYFDSIYASDLPARAVNVYRYLRDRANKDGQCWPAIGTIARDLHVSRSTGKRALKDLEQAGFVGRENRKRVYEGKLYGKCSNRYTVVHLPSSALH